MIELIDVRKRYRLRQVLKGVSFTVEKGRITCLIGVNGSGKSTIMKAIMRLVPIQAGNILIDGRALSGPDLYEKVAFIPDRLTMPPGMKLSEAMRFMRDFHRNWNEARGRELMAFFRLDASERIGNLSKGTAAKFNLVLGFAQETDYVLMDEPLAGIDVFSREHIAKVFTSDMMEDRGVLLTTHEIGEMEQLLDRAVLLKDGVIVRDVDCERLRDEEGKSVIDVMREVYVP
jgi:ABC-2 type transport system ATP-binding protein